MRAPIRAALLAFAAVLAAGGTALLAQGVPGAVPPGAARQSAESASETTPATIFGSKLVVWLDAASGVTGSSPVTAWQDQKNSLTFTAAGSPDLVDESGVAGIEFARADGDYFYRTLTVEPTDAPMCFYVVAKFATTGSFLRNLGCVSTAGGTDHRFLLGTATNLSPRATTATTSVATASYGSGLSTGTRYVVQARFVSDSDRRVNVDQGTEAQNTNTRDPNTPDRVGVGSARGDAAEGTMDGVIYQWLLLDADPSTEEHDAYLAYADERYDIPGITTLPPLTGPGGPLPWLMLGAAVALALLALRRPRARAGRVIRLPDRAATRQAA